jgi:ABC transporter
MRIEATIEVPGLRKRFGPAVAPDGLSFTMLPGRVTGVVGPNGAGKSTTMRDPRPGLRRCGQRMPARSASWPMPPMARRPHPGNDPAAPGANEGGRLPLAPSVPADAGQA